MTPGRFLSYPELLTVVIITNGTGESIPNLPAIVISPPALQRPAFNLGLLCGVNSSTTRDKASHKFPSQSLFGASGGPFPPPPPPLSPNLLLDPD